MHYGVMVVQRPIPDDVRTRAHAHTPTAESTHIQVGSLRSMEVGGEGVR